MSTQPHQERSAPWHERSAPWHERSAPWHERSAPWHERSALWHSRPGVVARAAVGGLAIAASIPPWGFWPLVFVGVALLDGLLAGQLWRSRFARTWLLAAFWLYPATLWMWDLTAPGYLVAGALFAAYFAAAGALTPGGRHRRLVLPGAIAVAELARWSWPFGGVPLAHLALSQVDTPLALAARVGGPLLVVVTVVVVGQTLTALPVFGRLGDDGDGGDGGDGDSSGSPGHDEASTTLPSTANPTKTSPGGRWKTVAIGFGVAASLVAAGALHPRSEVVDEIDVALVQGGGPQQTRASSSQEPVVLGRHVEASRFIDGPVDLIIWPENVVNTGPLLSQEDAERLVHDVAATNDASVLAGWFTPISDEHTVNYHSTITPDGEEIDRYDKVRLVPFGEYVPLRGLVEAFNDEIPGRDVLAGEAEPVLDTPVGPVGVSISWEGFFETRSRHAVRAGAQLLTNPTNGSSYWLTQVQSQQVGSNQLRAIENDRWVLQVAPTGFSAVIDPEGNVQQRTGTVERATLTATVEMRSGRTLGSRVGFWPVLAYGLVAITLARIRPLGGVRRSLRVRSRLAHRHERTGW